MKKSLKYFLIFILLICFAFSIYVFKLKKEINSQNLSQSELVKTQALEQVKKKAEGDGSNYWIGTSTPKIIIVEFSDFNCPYCKASFQPLREISLKYKDIVKIIYRDAPILEGSENLAQIARCSGEQGKFWPIYDKFFANQKEEGATQFSQAEILNLAKNINLNINQFNSCVSSQKYKLNIQKDLSDAADLKITGTPTWFVNGYKIEGAITLEAWEKIINKLLSDNAG